MPKCLWIDASNRVVVEKTFDHVADLGKMVGGSIELAYHWQNGDVLYVDEDGLRKYRDGFDFALRSDQWLAGNGVVVGREVEGRQYKNGYTNLDPTISQRHLVAIVQFRRAA